MTKLYNLYVYLGRILWPIQLPLMRFFIKRTRRVYVLIVQGNQVLLTKNWLSDGRYALPGGGIARHESIEQALERELDEEIGVRINPEELKFVSKGVWQTHRLGFRYDLYVLRSDIKPGHVRKLEIVEVGWRTIDSLNETNCSLEIISALKLI